MVTREQYLEALAVIKAYKKQYEEDFLEIYLACTLERKEELLEKPLTQCDLSYSLYSALIHLIRKEKPELDRSSCTVKHLQLISYSVLKEHGNIGPKKLDQLLAFCFRAGITLKP